MLLHIRMIDPEALRTEIKSVEDDLLARPEANDSRFLAFVDQDLAVLERVASLRDQIGGLADFKDGRQVLQKMMDLIHERDGAGVDPANGDRPEDPSGEAKTDDRGDLGDGSLGPSGAGESRCGDQVRQGTAEDPSAH